MPVYDYICDWCTHKWEMTRVIEARDNPAICPQCGKIRSRRLFKGANIEVFKPMVYHDICEYPILIKSKKQLKEECKKHGVKACRLM